MVLRSRSALLFAASAIALTTASPANAAINIGDLLEVQYLFPTEANIIEASGQFTYTGAGQSILTQGGVSTVVIFNDRVIFQEFPGCGPSCTQTLAAFNGPVLLNFTNSAAFTGWNLLSDTVGVTSTILEGGRIGVNWQGATVQGEAIIGATVAPVPEPTTWAMMLLGFGFVGGAMRCAKRRQKLTVSYA